MKILIFGATGLAGAAVLTACLAAPVVDEVRTITRRPVRVENDKLRKFIHDDFLNYTDVRDAFADADACLFCLGVSVTQVSGEAEYRKITRDFALAVGQELRKHSPQAVFHYISGQATSLTSRMMWARVKAEAERDLMALAPTVAWRPAFIDGAPSSHTPKLLKFLRPLLGLLEPFPGLYVKGQDIGYAMIQATSEKIQNRVIENKEIREMAERYRKQFF